MSTTTAKLTTLLILTTSTAEPCLGIVLGREKENVEYLFFEDFALAFRDFPDPPQLISGFGEL